MILPQETIKWIGPLLMGISFIGFAWTILRALSSGASEYADSMSEETSREFEDMFLFIPPKRIAEIGWASAAVMFLLFAIPLFDMDNPISTTRSPLPRASH